MGSARHPAGVVVCLLGGLLYFSGMLIMVYNVWKTVSDKKPEPVAVLEPA